MGKKIRTFVLQRHNDVSGVSGIGIVADGIQWPDGMCTIHWRGKHPTDNTHLSLESVRDIHCHEGATDIVWTDDESVLIDTDETRLIPADQTFDELIAGSKHRKQ